MKSIGSNCTSARFEMWMRTPAVDGDLAPALTAYATDLTLIGTALRPLEGFNHRGTEPRSPRPLPPTPSGSIGYSAPIAGYCFVSTVPVLAHGRCFGRGDVLSEDGSLVASYAQEALLRFREAGAQVEA
jgi:acyl-CoA thioesterase II